ALASGSLIEKATSKGGHRASCIGGRALKLREQIESQQLANTETTERLNESEQAKFVLRERYREPRSNTRLQRIVSKIYGLRQLHGNSPVVKSVTTTGRQSTAFARPPGLRRDNRGLTS